jgi:hypothetical protein
MKNADFTKKHDSNPATLPLADLPAKLQKQALNVTPLDVCAHGVRKYGF